MKWQNQVYNVLAMPVNWNTIGNQRLIDVVFSIETPDQLRRFFDDLMTDKEIEFCVLKMHAAFLIFLAAPYREIINQTGLSTATIAHISKLMRNRKGGYQEAMKRLYPHGYQWIE